MGAPEVEATLKAALESANFWGEVSAFIVVVGVVMELLEVLFFDKTIPLKERRVLIAGSILVVIGVGGELVFANRVSTLAAQIQQFSDENVAQAQKESAAARREAAEANRLAKQYESQIALANSRSSQAKEQSVKAEARAAEANLALEKFKTPRSLTAVQFATIVEKLKPFGKVPFIVSVADAAEAVDLIGQISKALENAGWNWKDWAKSDGGLVIGKSFSGKPTMNSVTARGILIEVSSIDLPALGEPAAAFRDALTSAGLIPSVRVVTPESAKSEKKLLGVIHITIGTKQ